MSRSASDTPHLRLSIVGVVVLSLFAVLFARLWFLQVMAAEEYEQLSQANRVRVIAEEAPRGRILDRTGTVLVDNRTSLVVTVEPGALEDLEPAEREVVVGDLAAELTAFGVPSKVDRIERRLTDPQFNPLQPVPVAIDVPEEFDVFLAERTEQFPGVSVRRESVRSYPHDELAAHILGYVGRISVEEWEAEQAIESHEKPYEPDDNIGKTGVERAFEHELRGVPGQRVVEVDAQGRVVRTVEHRLPRPGNDIVLAVDLEVQERAESELAAQLAAVRGSRRAGQVFSSPAGSVVLLDPRDGSIRALASYPTFEPADFVNGISSERYERLTGGDASQNPLTNRAVTGLYAPGSTLKPFTAVAALQAGMVEPQSTIDDPGVYTIENCTGPACTLRNAGSQRFGPVDLRRSLTVSSNVYYFWLADRAYRQREARGDVLQDGIRQFGFGAATGVDLAGEAAGVVPDAEWKRDLYESMSPEEQALGDPNWYPGDAANISVGQGDLLATPLQVANAYGSIANGGTLWRPRLVDRVLVAGGSIDDPDDLVYVVEPEPIGEVPLPAEWLAALTDGLAGVTAGPGGTAVGAFEGWDHAAWPVAGKTGTAEVAGRADSAVFAAYGPVHAPEIVGFAVLEESGFGGEAAAPLVRRVLAPIAGMDLAADDDEADPDELAASGGSSPSGSGR